MTEVGYSKSQPESKFDFRAVYDHRSAVFSSRIRPLSLSSSSLGTARPEVAQTRQESYLLEERVLRVTAGCSLFLDYSSAMLGWRTGREQDREREGKNGRTREEKRAKGIETDGGETCKRNEARAFQWKHRKLCLPLSKIKVVLLGCH